ncbi:hypothetical protein [Saliphagus infecundisoli]|uniref:Uncharacterized protein n=1 Tax=Saliphagus infecundisoli TaxID=1849069 RepID=A0ABD5QL34_9EURY|nr:hypothetical protein [Saliphagus infecundisoli]
MVPNDKVLQRVIQATKRVLGRQSVTAVQISVFVAAVVVLIQPVVAQSALEEAGDVACSGALGQMVFLGFGLLTLILILVGLAQIGLGFVGTGGGGGGRRGERNNIINGFITLVGGLFLGSMSAVLDYLGINLDGCLQGGEILVIMPFMF